MKSERTKLNKEARKLLDELLGPIGAQLIEELPPDLRDGYIKKAILDRAYRERRGPKVNRLLIEEAQCQLS